jgi:aminoglycoside 6'-N-acetyltransferase
MTAPSIDLRGPRVRLRTGDQSDVAPLLAHLSDPGVRRWWREPPPAAQLLDDLRGLGSDQLLVIEVEGTVVGGIQFGEETEPDYRSASIDIFIGDRWQGRGVGKEAIGLLVDHLLTDRGHHRITIDPAVANERAIACYRAVGFRPVGVMRQYERDGDGGYHDNLLLDLVASDLGSHV